MRYARVIDGRVAEVYDDAYTAIPEGCEVIRPQDAEAMRNHPFGFGVFRKNGVICQVDPVLVAQAESRTPLSHSEITDALAEIVDGMTVNEPSNVMLKLQNRADLINGRPVRNV